MTTKHEVALFRPYVFHVGQKITIDGGPRHGDWEVIGVTDRKLKLRCPISGREVEWAHFCYFAEARNLDKWPDKD